MTKTILACFHEEYIGLLIPKKRGEGFLRVPLGHHNCPLSELERDIGIDIYGTQGSLTVMTGYIHEDQYPELTERVILPISQLLEYPFRIVGKDEYFKHHPLY